MKTIALVVTAAVFLFLNFTGIAEAQVVESISSQDTAIISFDSGLIYTYAITWNGDQFQMVYVGIRNASTFSGRIKGQVGKRVIEYTQSDNTSNYNAIYKATEVSKNVFKGTFGDSVGNKDGFTLTVNGSSIERSGSTDQSGGVAPSGYELRIRALIDGRSRIYIQNNRLWWEHLDFDLPGKNQGRNEPTYLNGKAWQPSWSGKKSSSYDLSDAGLHLGSTYEVAEFKANAARGSAKIETKPSSANDGVTVINFDDNAAPYADWYEVTVKFSSTATSVQQTKVSPAKEHVIFSNFNPAAVQSGPTHTMRLNLSAPFRITYIQNYHYFNNGTPPGTIALKHEDGTIYGPWQAEGADLGGSVPNAYWIVRPNVEVKAGNYNVIDSSPSTWSYNQESKNWGMTQIKGIKLSR